MDVYDGRRRAVSSAEVRNARFTTDRAGAARFARGAGNDNVSKLYHREKQGAPWVLINDESVSGVVEHALGFSADGLTAYLQTERKNGPDAIVAWNPATGERKEVLADPVVDPYSAVRAADSDIPVGAYFMHDRVRTRFFDPQSTTAKLYRQLEKAFPDSAVAVTSATEDGKLRWCGLERPQYRRFDFDTAKKPFDLVFSRKSCSSRRSSAHPGRDAAREVSSCTVLTRRGQDAARRSRFVAPHGGRRVFDMGLRQRNPDARRAGYALLRVNSLFRAIRPPFHQAARATGSASADDSTTPPLGHRPAHRRSSAHLHSARAQAHSLMARPKADLTILRRLLASTTWRRCQGHAFRAARSPLERLAG